jgi:Flp pilus assembly protein TadD
VNAAPDDVGAKRRLVLQGWLAAGLLLAAAAAVYSDSMGGAFVFDDVPAILENPTIRGSVPLARLLNPPGDQAGTVGGRPVVNLSLALNYGLGGTRPWGYHAFNLGVHAAAALLLFGIVRRTLCRRGDPARNSAEGLPWSSRWPDTVGLWIAFFAALLWEVHPLQTEAVTYVVQRAESLMGFFYLLTIYGFVRYAERDRGRDVEAAPSTRKGIGCGAWGVLAVAACLLGMATKEVMVSAPLLVLLYDRTFVAGSAGEALRRRRWLYGGLGSTWLLLAVLAAGTHGRGGSAGFGSSAGVWPYALTQCGSIVRYLRLAFWPDRLVFDYGTALVANPGQVIPQILILSFLLAATAYGLLRHPAAGFLAFGFFALLAPTSSLFPIATEPAAEHRMYLPLAVVSVLVVTGIHAAASRLAARSAQAALCALFVVAALGLGATTIRRNRDYRSEAALWADTAQKEPSNPRAHNNLAEALLAGGRPAEATAEFAAAVAADPNYAPAQYNLGVMLLDSGRAREAVAHLEKALSAPRHQAELQLYLGEAFERTGRPTEAVERFREALRLAPGNPEAAFGLGNNLAVLGRYSEAANALEIATALSPDKVQIRNNLANALLFSGRTDEAIREYREALRRDPGNESVKENLKRALSAAGQGDGR